jgi:hypothetical protein
MTISRRYGSIVRREGEARQFQVHLHPRIAEDHFNYYRIKHLHRRLKTLLTSQRKVHEDVRRCRYELRNKPRYVSDASKLDSRENNANGIRK